MNFDYSPKVQHMQARLLEFMDAHVYPNEDRFFQDIADNRAKGNAWIPSALVEELKPKAKAAGLWNLFLPHSPRAPALRKSLLLWLMKNCAEAECGALVRAMAMLPRTLERPFFDSLEIDSRVSFSVKLGPV